MNNNNFGMSEQDQQTGIKEPYTHEEGNTSNDVS